MKPSLLLLLFLPAASAAPAAPETIAYWIEECRPAQTGCAFTDVELVEWALEDWAAASGGRLIWKRASSPIGALFHIRWAAPHDQQHGVAQPFLSGRRHGSTIRIRPDLSRFPGAVGERGRADALYRDTVVYLTALHELGHGLGMNHAAAPGPIMYNGRLLPQVFSRYRTRLKSRSDIRRFSAVTEFDRNRLSALLFARSTTSRPPE